MNPLDNGTDPMNPTTPTSQPASTPPAAPPPGVTLDDQPVQLSAPSPGGVTFDADPVPGAPSAGAPTSTIAAPTVPVPSSLHIDPNGNPLVNAARRANAVGAGVGDAALDTLTGIGRLSNRFDDSFNMPGSAARHAGVDFLAQRQRELEQTNRENPGLNMTGQTAETLAEFLSGDELLKGLSMGDKFTKFSKIASALESSPLAMRAFNIGANAIRQGTVQAATTYAKTGDAITSAAQGGYGALATGAIESAFHIPSIYKEFFSNKVVQDGLQNNIRAILAKAADAAGIDPAITDTPSLRDAASAVGGELKARASTMYGDLDSAVGGRIQKFREDLDAVNDAIHNHIEGLDDEAAPQLTDSFQRVFGTHPGDLTDLETKKAAIVAARDAAVEKIKVAGLDPAMLDKADALYRQGSALATDVSNAIRNSLSGLRPELANPATNSAETVVTSKLIPRLNKLADRGRLADAIGPQNADALLQHVDEAHVAEKHVAARLKAVAFAAKTGFAAGGLGAGYEAAKHAFSSH